MSNALKLDDLKEGVLLVAEDKTEIEIQSVIGKCILCISNICGDAYIVSLADLNKYNYTIKQPGPVEEWIPKVGEWVTCIKVDLKNKEVEVHGAGWENNLTFKATKIEKWHESVSVVFGGYEGSGVYTHSLRKALPHEIPAEPKYLFNEIEELRNCDIDDQVFDKKLKRILYKYASQPKWIPVSERLPSEKDANKYGKILVCYPDTSISTVNYEFVGASINHKAWMTLEPYKEK